MEPAARTAPTLEQLVFSAKRRVPFSPQPSQSSFCCVTQIGSGPRPNPLAAKRKGRAWLRRGSAGDQCSQCSQCSHAPPFCPDWPAVCTLRSGSPTTLTLMPWPPVPGRGERWWTGGEGGTYHLPQGQGGQPVVGCWSTARGLLLPFPRPGCCQLIAQVRPGSHLPSPSFPF